MKHTKGPWTILDTAKLLQADSGSYICLVLADDFSVEGDVGQTYGSNTSAETARANARLISAAPEMLDALIQSRGLIVQLCNDIKSNYGLDIDVNALLLARNVDAAIAKARGKK